MKIVVYNLGCKVNKYECDSLVKKLRENGHIVSEELEYADAYILNTCAVTNEAERKSRQCVERCLKFNEMAKIYVCGCASQNNPKQFLEKENVSYVIGNAKKMSLVDSLDKEGISNFDLPKEYEDDFSPTIDRTRAFIKVQDGCNKFCSYCLIPYVRGRSRSRKIESIYKECLELSLITKEIVITGIDLSDYGKDIGTNFVELIKSLKDINCRIRLGSLEMNMISNDLLEALRALKAFCPHFHLSLQSGDDEVLKKMNRKYDTKSFYEEVKLIKNYFPDAAITTDLICAFPTESEEQFQNTLRYLEKIEFSQIHIFPYSRRNGTNAAKYPLINGDIVKDRCKRAKEVANKLYKKYLEKMLGKTLEILIESNDGEYYIGYSREYIHAKIKKAEVNSIVLAKAIKIDGDSIICE